MNDLFEVKRYWSDSGEENEDNSKQNEEEHLIDKDAINAQETDLLNKLKTKAVARETYHKGADQKLQDKLTSQPDVEHESAATKNNVADKAKKRKKRKNRKNPKDGDGVETVNKGGFPVLGQNLADQWKNKKIKRSLPSWLANPDIISVDLSDHQMNVESLKGLDQRTISNLKSNSINHFFPVQRQVIPYMLANDSKSIYPPHDICVSAPTGSGKTLAYVLPIGNILYVTAIVYSLCPDKKYPYLQCSTEK